LSQSELTSAPTTSSLSTGSGTVERKPFAIAGADVFTMRDGLVSRKDSYLDWLAYQRQVGIDPMATFKALGR
jgi:hypothetical protein